MGTVYSMDKESKKTDFLEEKINRFKRDISNVFRAKKISDRTFENIMYKLNFISKYDALFFDFNMGKFLATFANDSATAIDYFETAKSIDNTFVSVYYQLYKCYAKVGNFYDALSNLYDCRDLVDEKEGAYDTEGNLKENFTLPIKMLYSLLDMEECFDEYCENDYSVPIHNKYCFCEIRNEEMLALYHNVIKMFNDRNYLGCLDALNEMNEKINTIKYPMEIDTLISIVEESIEKEAERYYEMYQNGEIIDVTDAQNMEKIIKILKANKMSAKQVFCLINTMIDVDIEKVPELFALTSDVIDTEEYRVELKYLKLKYKERYDYLQLDMETRKKYEQLLIEAKELYGTGDMGAAFELYRKLKQMTELPICDYYIGKTLYYQNRFADAKESFETYLSQGGFYYQKSLGFLANINMHSNKQGKALQKINAINKINKMFDIDFDFDYGYFFRKGRYIKDIDMTVEDFMTSENTATENKVLQKKRNEVVSNRQDAN